MAPAPSFPAPGPASVETSIWGGGAGCMQPWFEAVFWRERELPAGLLGFDAAGSWAPAAQVDVLVEVIDQLGAAGVRVRYTSQESSDRQAFAEVPAVSGANIRMAEPRTKARAPLVGTPAAAMLGHRVDEPYAAGVNAAAQRLPTRTAAASRLSRRPRSPHGWCSSTSSRP